MLAGELGLAGIRPVVLDPMPGPNPEPRANGIVGQAIRILDHRGLYRTLAATEEPPRLNPRAMFAAFPLDLALMPDSQLFLLPIQQPKLVQVLAERAREYDTEIRWGHALTGLHQHDDRVTVHVSGPAVTQLSTQTNRRWDGYGGRRRNLGDRAPGNSAGTGAGCARTDRRPGRRAWSWRDGRRVDGRDGWSSAEGGPHRRLTQPAIAHLCEIRALPGCVGQRHDENQRPDGRE